MSEKIEGTNKKSVNNIHRDYKNADLVLGEPQGLLDTVHILHQELEDLFIKAKSQMWSGKGEFDFTPCLKEFAKQDDNADIMIDTISYQYQADSLVAKSLLPIMSPFITNSEMNCAFAFNTAMECEHAIAYSEMVKTSFTDPEAILKKIIESQETADRMSKVEDVLEELYQAGLKYGVGNMSKDEAFPIVYRGMTAIYLLERIQFIASFAITFGLGEAGLFLPIANCVKKICADEIGVHSLVDEYVLREMRKMKYWKHQPKEFHDNIIEIIDDVERIELEWTDFIFKDRTIVGLTPELVKDWVRFNVQMLKQSMDLPFEVKVKENPLPWMNNWLSLNKFQNAPQEIEKSDYAVGAMRDDLDDGEDFDV